MRRRPLTPPVVNLPDAPVTGHDDPKTMLMELVTSPQAPPLQELVPAFAQEWACGDVAAVELVMAVAFTNERLDDGAAIARVLKEMSESDIHLWRHKAAYFHLWVRGTRLEFWASCHPRWTWYPLALFVVLPALLFLRLRIWLSFTLSEMARRRR